MESPASTEESVEMDAFRSECTQMKYNGKPGKSKEYNTEEDVFVALRNNERRIKSSALNQIKKQIQRLVNLKTIEMSIVFCVSDIVQQRQLIKFCGKGKFLKNLKECRPILSAADLQKSQSFKEDYLPKSKGTCEDDITFVSPTKLSCAPGVSKDLAKRQRERLMDVEVVTEHAEGENSFSIDLESPVKRKKSAPKAKLAKCDNISQKKKKTAKRKLVEESDEESEKEPDMLPADLDVLVDVLPEQEIMEIEKNKEKNNKHDKIDTDKQISKTKKSKIKDTLTKEQDNDEEDLPILQVSEKSIKRKTKNKEAIPMYSATDITRVDEENHWCKDVYYAVAFDNTWYPGIVTDIDGNNNDFAWLKYLHPYGESFKWPDKQDIGLTHINAALQKVSLISKNNGRLWSIENRKQIDDLYKSQSSVTVATVEPAKN